MKEVRVAIVGMGIGRANAKGFLNNERSRITALCDLDETRMKAFAEELPGEVALFTDYRKLCQNKDIDAIFIGTPNQFHVPIGLEAVKRDKHILVTKPLADNLPNAKKLVEAAEASGVVNMMSLSTRFSGNVQHLEQLARAQEFGEIYYARARSIRRNGIPDWSLGFIQQGGGAFRDMGVHVLDSIWWIMGRPKPVTVSGVAGAKFGPYGKGFSKNRQPDEKYYKQFAADDYAGGFIRCEDGQGLQVESFWASHQKEALQLEIFGTEAGAQLNPLTIYKSSKGVQQDLSVEITDKTTSWERIADHFVASILDGVPCDAPLRDGLTVQEMLEALLRSAETGKEVRVQKAEGQKKMMAMA